MLPWLEPVAALERSAGSLFLPQKSRNNNMPHGNSQPLISILARERQALDRANARQGRTVSFYDDLIKKYGSRP
jgi:hypothetical protein